MKLKLVLFSMPSSALPAANHYKVRILLHSFHIVFYSLAIFYVNFSISSHALAQNRSLHIVTLKSMIKGGFEQDFSTAVPFKAHVSLGQEYNNVNQKCNR